MNAPGPPRPIGIAVLGAGRIGRLHAELVARRVPGTRLVGVADLVADLAAKVAVPLGARAASPEELLSDDEVDAVAVCSSTDTHVALVVEAARAGKAVFCEKPIAHDLPGVDRALDAVRSAGVSLMVGFNRRFDPAHAAVRAAVADGEVGSPHLVRITSRDPEPPPASYALASGGIFLDMMIHDFDMARFVTGSEVSEVTAVGAVRIVPELAEVGDVDTAIVTLRHADGCITAIDNSRRAVYGYDQRVEVLGERGLAASENPHEHSALRRDAAGTRLAPLPYFFLERYATSYARQWDAFAESLRSGAEPPTTGGDGRAALVIALAARRSLLEHRTVATSEIEAR